MDAKLTTKRASSPMPPTRSLRGSRSVLVFRVDDVFWGYGQGVSLLIRRTWSLAQTDDHLLNHVQWWRCYYHFIRPHETLRDRTPSIPQAQRHRTPAMAAGLTDHIWTVEEVLRLPLLTRLGDERAVGSRTCAACAA
jgi:hypothetical protein